MTEKHRRLITIFTEHPVAANLLMALMILAGIAAISKLNTQFFPEFNLNKVQVKVDWPGANAEDVAKSITRPFEQALRKSDYLKSLKSTSRLGVSSLTLTFKQGSNMGDRLNQVREKIDQIRNLPTDSEKPEITRLEQFDTVAKLILSGPQNLQALRPVAYSIERELLDAGIAKIDIAGLPQQQITIAISTKKLIELQLTLDQIAEQIRKKSQDVPAGTIGRSQLGKQLRAIQQKRTIKDFEELPLASKKENRLLYLKDIASISLEPQDQEHLLFYNNQPAIVLQLLRSKTTSALGSAEVLNNWLAHFRPTLGPHIHIHVFNKRWSLIKERINLLLKNGLGGLILIIGILLFFLHSRIAWWVLLGIPTSFCAALGVLYLLGGSINMVSLFALIMTLGIIVDDTIVVSEATFSQLQKGNNPLNSVTAATRQMLVPVLSSSLTTICAFIPLLIVSGVIGQILLDIPIVVICVICASLVECFFVLPGHLYHSLKNQVELKESPIRKKINRSFNRFRDYHFKRMLILALKYSGLTLTAALALFMLAFALLYFGLLKFNFFPSPEGRLLYANVQFTAGTQPNIVKRFTKQVAHAAEQTSAILNPKGDKLITTLLRYENQTAKVGNASSSYGEQYGGVELELLSPDQRRINNQQFINQWRRKIKMPAGIENFSITTQRAGPPGVELDISLSGTSLGKLKTAAAELIHHLKIEAGVSNIKDNIPHGQNQLVFSLNATGKALGLTIQDVSKQLRAALSGSLAEIYHTETDEIEVRVMLPKNERHDLSLLKRFPIITSNGTITPLETIITVDSKKGFE